MLMLCNKTGCEEAQDFISFTVNDANNENATVIYKEYLLKDLEMEKKWIQMEVKFKITTKRINVSALLLESWSFKGTLMGILFQKAFVPPGKKSSVQRG